MPLQIGDIEIWTKPILPTGDLAFSIVNLGYKVPKKVTVKISDLGLNNPAGYYISEVFDGVQLPKKYLPTDLLSVRVNPSGVFFGKAKQLS